MTDPETPRRGRKRNEESRRVILDAAVALAGEPGRPDFTMAGIADRAGVSKQTVYRWWPTKSDVLMEALIDLARARVSVEDHGSYALDLEAFLSDTIDAVSLPGVTGALRSLIAEAQLDGEFEERFRTGFLAHRRSALREVIDRAATRGDLPPIVPAEQISDIVFGVVWYRLLMTSRPLDRTDVVYLTHLLARAPSRSE